MSVPRLTRRGALGTAAGAALLASTPQPAGAAPGAPETTAAILVGLLTLEEATAIAYDELGGRLAARLATHEREQAAALETALEALGARRPDAAAARSAYARRRAARDGARAAAVALERDAVQAHRDAIGRLENPNLIRTLATIMAAAAQHLVALGENPPSPGGTGDRL